MAPSIEDLMQQMANFIAASEAARKESEAARKDAHNARVQSEGYIAKDALALEREVTRAVYAHLIRHMQGYKLHVPYGFPNKLYDPTNGSLPLTDLDGVFVLTRDPSVQELHTDFAKLMPVDDRTTTALAERSKEMRPYARDLSRLSKVSEASEASEGTVNTRGDTRLVIVEAKHHVTIDKIKAKLAQMEAIRSYLLRARSLNDGDLDKKFVKNVQTFKFETYDPQPMLYIGGTYWDPQALDYFQKELFTDANLKGFLGIVQTNGSRFSVVDSHSAFAHLDAAGGSKTGRKNAHEKKKERKKKASASAGPSKKKSS